MSTDDTHYEAPTLIMLGSLHVLTMGNVVGDPSDGVYTADPLGGPPIALTS